MAGRVAKVESDTVTVELSDEGCGQAGANQRCGVKARVPNVVPVPPTAVVKRDGGEVVYVLGPTAWRTSARSASSTVVGSARC